MIVETLSRYSPKLGGQTATGSGKTTTLYAILQVVQSNERKILTLEDPIEYEMPGITQTQIKPKIGFTFANGLRSLLRHDPDVILVGEIRDKETAEMAIHASLTGHLVLSSIHTNDAPGAVTRLIDMGIEPFLVASSLRAVISQRLVRVLCNRCKSPNEDQSLHSVGCEACQYTGYFGRTAVSEVMVCDERLCDAVKSGLSSHNLYEMAVASGMTPVQDDALDKVRSGVTDLLEVQRVLGKALMTEVSGNARTEISI